MPAKAQKPESPSQCVERLAACKQWRLIVPYYARDVRNQPTRRIARHTYPPRDVGPYTFAEARELLQIFCQRWTGNGEHPPPELEPVAVEVNDDPRTLAGRRRPLLRFALRDVAEGRLAEPPAPAFYALPDPADDDDDAGRWLRESGHGDRHIDL